VFGFEGAFPGRFPLLRDPYESRLVTVQRSLIPNAGEGLFATCNMPSGVIICYYWGCQQMQAEVNERSSKENQNVVLLDSSDTVVLDVPAPYGCLSHYCATLGHKANHNEQRPNCAYVDAFHPRFGVTSALKTLCDIRTGEEIVLDYEFIDIPEWLSGQQHECA
jgi:histone-lysine N-methyltransferase SETD7